MRHILTYTIGLLATAGYLLLGGCERRELTYPEPEGELAIIPIHIDWTESHLEQDANSRASVWLFPLDGRTPIENHFQGNITDITLKAPVGDYAIIIFNETKDDSRWQGYMEFRGTDKYETFGAYLLENKTTQVYGRAADTTYHHTALPLAAWSIDNFVVTRSMVDLTRSRALAETRAGGTMSKAEQTSVDQMLEKVATVKPQPMVRSVFIKTKVYNLNSSYGALASLSGAAEGILLASGKLITTPVIHWLKMNNRQIEENQKDGTVENQFLTFGLLKGTETIVIEMTFQLWNDTWYDDPKPFDITDIIADNEEYHIELQLGHTNPEEPEEPEDHPIILPTSNVDVGDWEDKFIDIK